VIEAVAKKAGWKPGARGEGGKGAASVSPSTRTSPPMWRWIADVEIDRTKRTHCGCRASTPRSMPVRSSIRTASRNQIEGGIVQSMSWTLKEEVKFDSNEISSRDWATYPILTMPRFRQSRSS